MAGLLFVLTDPPLWLGYVLIWGYVVARAAHFIAYATAQLHDVRAACWSVSSFALLAMVAYTIVHVIGT